MVERFVMHLCYRLGGKGLEVARLGLREDDLKDPWVRKGLGKGWGLSRMYTQKKIGYDDLAFETRRKVAQGAPSKQDLKSEVVRLMKRTGSDPGLLRGGVAGLMMGRLESERERIEQMDGSIFQNAKVIVRKSKWIDEEEQRIDALVQGDVEAFAGSGETAAEQDISEMAPPTEST